MQVLVLNGSISGPDGSTEQCLKLATTALVRRGLDVAPRTLIQRRGLDAFLADVRRSDGLLIGTGTYWDSWGSPLQRLLEDIAGLDSTKVLFGKPVGLVVTGHSVGGKGVLSRLMGVLNTMGLWVPPHGGMVYNAVAHWALGLGLSGWQAEETWHLDDLDIVAHNLAEATLKTNQWKAWPVSGDPDEPFRQRWLNP
jgi:multimeric flavodoxin WrbA